MNLSTKSTHHIHLHFMWLYSKKSGALTNSLFALFCAFCLFPLLITRALYGMFLTRRLFEESKAIGLGGKCFKILDFTGSAPGKKLGRIFNIVRGDLAFIGPELTLESNLTTHPKALIRYRVRPGLLSPYQLQQAVGIAYQDQLSSDRTYVFDQSLKGDLAIAAKSLPALILGHRGTDKPDGRLNIFGITIDNATMNEAIGDILTHAAAKTTQHIAFVNPDCLNIACRDDNYRHVLGHCDRVFADGIGLQIAARMLRRPLRANVNGTDLFPLLCQSLANEQTSLFLLGARPGVAEQTAQNMLERFPGLQIAGTQHGYFADHETQDVIQKINDSGAQILLAAFGAPRQELWLHTHAGELAPRVRIGVGGLFDFYSGRIPRAPMWMREVGLEWTWRLLQEPGRMWRRYVIGNPLFLARVFQQARIK